MFKFPSCVTSQLNSLPSRGLAGNSQTNTLASHPTSTSDMAVNKLQEALNNNLNLNENILTVLNTSSSLHFEETEFKRGIYILNKNKLKSAAELLPIYRQFNQSLLRAFNRELEEQDYACTGGEYPVYNIFKDKKIVMQLAYQQKLADALGQLVGIEASYILQTEYKDNTWTIIECEIKVKSSQLPKEAETALTTAQRWFNTSMENLSKASWM